MSTGSKSVKVSVLIPSYNHASFIENAISSVLSQSFQDFEILITDDGSVDDTVDIIRKIEDSRIRLEVFANNRGACLAMNNLINRSRGEYIAVLNSDDMFLNGKLQKQVEFLDTNTEIGAVFGLPRFIDEEGELMRGAYHAFASNFAKGNRSRNEWLKQFFYFGNCLCHPTVMLRKDCYSKVKLFNPLLMQLPDLDFWIRLCTEFDIHILHEELTAFRVLKDDRNASAPTREKQARTGWETATILENFAELPDRQIRELFGNEPENAMISPKVVLALKAIAIRKPGYKQFGLALLRDCINAEEGSFPYAEYFRLVGLLDPYSVDFGGREYEYLRRSKAWFLVRRLARRVYGSKIVHQLTQFRR